MEADPLNGRAIADRLELIRSHVEANLERLSVTLASVEDSRKRWEAGKATRQILHESAYARLLARFESQPVIEQAKGILMAESHCSADEAFEMLRRASQRQNTRVRDLAAQIVARASSNRHRGSPGPQQGTSPDRRPTNAGHNGQALGNGRVGANGSPAPGLGGPGSAGS